MGRFKNRLMAALMTRFPGLFNLEKYADTVGRVVVEGIPWTPVKKPLKDSTVAVVTTAGVHLKSQKPFDMEDPDGDPSYRALPSDTPPAEYMITHDYYDHSDADRDLNIVFPIDRLREMASAGRLGSLAPVNYSFMGHITGPHVDTLVESTAPEVARRLKGEGVDAVLLTPGWGICNRSVGLVQRAIEAAGIPTIAVSIVRKFTEEVRSPRSVFLRWPMGHPLGEPGRVDQQMKVLECAFRALVEIKTPGTIVELPFRWRRYEDLRKDCKV